MKAEHRKELETNALADRMGRLLESVKAKPQRSTVWYVVVGVVAVVLVMLGAHWYSYGRAENSEAWYSYYLVSSRYLEPRTLLESHKDKMQGQAVRFEIAWEQLWGGIRRLGVDPRGGRESLIFAKEQYDLLREEFENDPVLLPEALFGLAVVTETLALEDRANLDEAKTKYEELATKHQKSAYGQLAKSRLDLLTEDESYNDIRKTYQDLARKIDITRPALPSLNRKK